MTDRDKASTGSSHETTSFANEQSLGRMGNKIVVLIEGFTD